LLADAIVTSGLQSFPVATFHVASGGGATPTHVTKVKATATVKVEVHTPVPGKGINKTCHLLCCLSGFEYNVACFGFGVALKVFMFPQAPVLPLALETVLTLP
jgi:hypothetical protein